MVIQKWRFRRLVLWTALAALVCLGAAIPSGDAAARPYSWTDLGPTGTGGDPTGDDQPSPTPKPDKAAHHPRLEPLTGDRAIVRGWDRLGVIWNAYRRLLPLLPR